MIIVVAPEAPNRRTGGHLVNERLSAHPDVALVACASLASAGESIRRARGQMPGRGAARDVVFLDSLFLTDAPGVASLKADRESLEGGSLGLLAHSLPSMIPGAPVDRRRRWLAAERSIMPLMDLAVAPSNFMRDAMVRRGLPAGRIHAVALAPIVDGRQDAERQQVGTRHSEREIIRLLTVANWSPAKGIHRVLTALRSARDLQWHWTIVGEWQSEYGTVLERDIRAECEEERVTVVSSADPQALRQAYRSADIFVLPSHMESFGLVYAEAITFGLPILASRAAAVPEVVGEAACLIRAGDDQALAARLRTLISSRALRNDLSRRARKRATGLPNWVRVRAQFVAVAQAAAGGA